MRRPRPGPFNFPAPPPVHVTSVYVNGDGSVTWEFDQIVIDCPAEPHGLQVDGSDPIDVVSFGSNAVTIDYNDAPNVGDPWQCVPPVSDIVFINHGALVPSSGMVISPP